MLEKNFIVPNHQHGSHDVTCNQPKVRRFETQLDNSNNELYSYMIKFKAFVVVCQFCVKKKEKNEIKTSCKNARKSNEQCYLVWHVHKDASLYQSSGGFQLSRLASKMQESTAILENKRISVSLVFLSVNTWIGEEHLYESI